MRRITIIHKQWILRDKIIDGDLNEEETAKAKTRIHTIWQLFDHIDKAFLRAAFDQIIEENQEKTEAVCKSNLTGVDRIIQIRYPNLQNDVLKRGVWR